MPISTSRATDLTRAVNALLPQNMTSSQDVRVTPYCCGVTGQGQNPNATLRKGLGRMAAAAAEGAAALTTYGLWGGEVPAEGGEG